MTRGQDHAQRKLFIENVLGTLMREKKDFDYIKYAKAKQTDGEFVRIADITGRAVTLEVTGMSLEAIVEDVARIILLPKEKIAPPASIVTDPELLRGASALFRRGTLNA